MTTLFLTVAEVLAAGENDAIGGQADDLDPVLLEVVDLVAADRAARAVDIEMARPRCAPLNGLLADVVDLAVGHVDVRAVDDDAEVRRAGDVGVTVTLVGAVVDTDVAAGRVDSR